MDAPEPLARSARPGRGPLVLVGGVVLAVATAAFVRVPLLPDMGRELGLSIGDLGLLTAVFAVGRLAMDLPAGHLADRLPAGPGLAASGVGVAIGGLLLATAQSYGQALAAMALIGASSALTNTLGMTTFATRAPAGRRGASMAGFSTSLITGQTLGPALGGALAGLVGWRAAQGSATAIGLGVAAVCLLAPAARRASRHGAPAAREQNGPPPQGLTRLEFAVLASVPFTSFFALGALPQTLVPLIGADELGLTASAIGLALGVGGVARFAGSIATGVLSDRVSRKTALLPNLLVMSAGVALLALPPSVPLWLTAIALLSVASAGIAVAATIVADRVPAATVGRRLASFRFTGDVGLLTGPAMATLVYEHSGREAAMLITTALLLACAAACAFLLRGGPSRPGEPLAVAEAA